MRTTTIRAHGGQRSLVVLVLLVTWAATAAAQSGFRVTHAVGGTTSTHVEVTGTVTNEHRSDVGDVSVTVEAVGAGGKVLARGITYVTSRLPENGIAPFSAKVPAAPGVVSYRATVTSFRFVQPFQGP